MRDKYARGRKKNWHAWAFKMPDGKGGWTFCHWAEIAIPRYIDGPIKIPSPGGKWVKVKFTEAT